MNDNILFLIFNLIFNELDYIANLLTHRNIRKNKIVNEWQYFIFDFQSDF